MFCAWLASPTGSSGFLEVVRARFCRPELSKGGYQYDLRRTLAKASSRSLRGADLRRDNALQRSVLDVQDIGKHQVCRDPFTQIGHDDDDALR